MSVPRVRHRHDESSHVRLVQQGEEVVEGHVPSVRPLVVAPADVQADGAGVDTDKGGVDRPDHELDPREELLERPIGEQGMAFEGEVGSIDLQDEPTLDDRPAGGWIWAIGAWLLFWKAPIWSVPYDNGRELHEHGWQLLAGNSFFLAMLVFLVGVAAMLAFRNPSGWRRNADPVVAERGSPRPQEVGAEPVSSVPGG